MQCGWPLGYVLVDQHIATQLPARLRLLYLLQILQTSRGSTQPYIQHLHGYHSRWKSGQGVTLSTHFHPVSKLRTRGAITPTSIRLHNGVHNFVMLKINFRLRDTVLLSFEGVRDPDGLVERLRSFRRKAVFLTSRSKRPKEDP